MQPFQKDYEEAKIYTISLYIEHAISNPTNVNVLAKSSHEATRTAIAQQKRLYNSNCQIVAQDQIDTGVKVNFISGDICKDVYKSNQAKLYWQEIFNFTDKPKNPSNREPIPSNLTIGGVRF